MQAPSKTPVTLEVTPPLVGRRKIAVNWTLRITFALSLAAHLGALAWFLFAAAPRLPDYTPQHVDVDVVWADSTNQQTPSAQPTPPPQAPPPQQAPPESTRAAPPPSQVAQQPLADTRQASREPPPPDPASAEPLPSPQPPAAPARADPSPSPPPVPAAAPPTPTQANPTHPPEPPVHGAPEVAAAIRLDFTPPALAQPNPVATVESSGNPTVGDAPPAYVADVLVRLQRALVYPAKARPGHLQGHLVIQFAVTRSGEVIDLAVVQSSGRAMFDQAALDMVRHAAPFPPLPADYDGETMPFTTPVRFVVR